MRLNAIIRVVYSPLGIIITAVGALCVSKLYAQKHNLKEKLIKILNPKTLKRILHPDQEDEAKLKEVFSTKVVSVL